MNVLILVCGEGLGHTSRCISLGKALETSGHKVYFGAYGYSYDLINRMGYSVNFIPSEISLIGSSGSLDLKASIIQTIKNGNIINLFSIQDLIKQVKPTIIVSDSYFSGILNAKYQHIPSYLILNQSNMEEFFIHKGKIGQMTGNFIKKIYSYVFEIVDGIIIPDYPMPYTICKKNIVFEKNLMNKVFYSGPLVGQSYEHVKAAEIVRPHVLSTIGGFGYRESLFLKVIEASKNSPMIHYTLLSGPSLDVSKFNNLPENINMLQFITDQFPYTKASSVIISAGGHSTLMEAMSFGIPIISFPDKDHSEQQNNASVIAENELGFCLDYIASSNEILNCINDIIYSNKFVENTKKMRELYLNLQPPKRICKYLEATLN